MQISKKLAIVAASGLATITVAGGAFAYFTANGTGNGAVKVGSNSPWKFQDVARSGGDINPNGFQQAITYNLKNESTGTQFLNGVSAEVTPDATNSDWVSGVPNCLRSWFDIQTSFGGVSFAPVGLFNASAVKSGKVVLQMNNGGPGAGINQDACQNQLIPVTLTAN